MKITPDDEVEEEPAEDEDGGEGEEE